MKNVLINKTDSFNYFLFISVTNVLLFVILSLEEFLYLLVLYIGILFILTSSTKLFQNRLSQIKFSKTISYLNYLFYFILYLFLYLSINLVFNYVFPFDINYIFVFIIILILLRIISRQYSMNKHIFSNSESNRIFNKKLLILLIFLTFLSSISISTPLLKILSIFQGNFNNSISGNFIRDIIFLSINNLTQFYNELISILFKNFNFITVIKFLILFITIFIFNFVSFYKLTEFFSRKSHNRSKFTSESILLYFLVISFLSILILFPESEKLINFLILIIFLIQIQNLVHLHLFIYFKDKQGKYSMEKVGLIQVFGIWAVFLYLIYVKSNILNQIAFSLTLLSDNLNILIIIAFFITNIAILLVFHYIISKMNFLEKIRVQYIVVYLLILVSLKLA